MNNITRNLHSFIEHKNISIRNFEKSIDVSYGAIGNAIRKNSAIGSDKIEKIITTYPEINPTWLLTGRGKMLESETTVKIEPTLEPHKLPKGSIPFWNLPVSAGHSVVDIVGSKTPDGYIMDLPGAGACENILPVTGYSMEPEVKEGALIGVKKVHNIEALNTERIYLIVTDEDRMIKRIEPDDEDDDILWCVSPNYKRFKIYKSTIIEMHRVCFVFNPV